MKVTYLGKSERIIFDGHTFTPGEPVEYAGSRLNKLRSNRFFEVEEVEQEHPFPTDSKDALEAWARENLSLELDKRKSLPKLIAEVEAKLKESVGGAD